MLFFFEQEGILSLSLCQFAKLPLTEFPQQMHAGLHMAHTHHTKTETGTP
jgi:hypothetical protein